MKPWYIKRTCLGCNNIYRMWFWENRVHKSVHFCSKRCATTWFTGWQAGTMFANDARTRFAEKGIKE